MRTLRIGTCIGLVVFLILGATARLRSAPELREDRVAWGEAHNGLRIGVYSVETVKASQPPEFRVVLQNVGEKDLVLNLGILLGNGVSQKPHAVRLFLTDAEERLRELILKPYRIGGRVDPMVVPLPAGASYVLRCSANEYVVSRPGEVAPLLKISELSPGAYHLRAEYTGKSVKAEFVNPEMPGFRWMPYWTGTVRSADLRFRISAE